MDGPVCLSIHPVKDSGDVSSSERVQTQLPGTPASVTTGAHGFAWTWVFIFLGRMPWSGMNVSYSKRRISFFKNLPNCSPERLDPFFFFFSFSSAMARLPVAAHTCRCFYFGRPRGRGVVAH